MTTLFSRDHFAQLPDELPESILKILKGREYDHPTTLSETGLDDFVEVFEDVHEDFEFRDEFNTVIELVLARAELEHDLLGALKFYDYALNKNYRGQYSDMTYAADALMEMGIDLDLVTIKSCGYVRHKSKARNFQLFHL